MNLLDLKQKIDIITDGVPDSELKKIRLVVVTNDSSVGPRASAEVTHINTGFDWETGRLNIITDVPLRKEKRS